MGRKNIRNLFELRQNRLNFRVECGCGRISVFEHGQLYNWAQAHGWPAGLAAVAARLKCTRCGQPPRHWGFCCEDANVDLQQLARDRRDGHLKRAQWFHDIARSRDPRIGARRRARRAALAMFQDVADDEK